MAIVGDSRWLPRSCAFAVFKAHTARRICVKVSAVLMSRWYKNSW